MNEEQDKLSLFLQDKNLSAIYKHFVSNSQESLFYPLQESVSPEQTEGVPYIN